MSADMDAANLRIRLFDAVGGDPDLAQAIWEIVSPELAERDALKAAIEAARTRVRLHLSEVEGYERAGGAPGLVRSANLRDILAALDTPSAPESPDGPLPTAIELVDAYERRVKHSEGVAPETPGDAEGPQEARNPADSPSGELPGPLPPPTGDDTTQATPGDAEEATTDE